MNLQKLYIYSNIYFFFRCLTYTNFINEVKPKKTLYADFEHLQHTVKIYILSIVIISTKYIVLFHKLKNC